MVFNFLYIVLAILLLSFLIFIHELGHFWMARRVGMRVEVFSIGFGKPIFSWIWNGVKWQIGWLLFGGYVKIAGTEDEEGKNPYEIPDGFFGKRPIDRIKVAAMGPIVNLVFALIVFAGVWLLGGREKNFSEVTAKIGWIDPQSELYSHGIRPGDEVLAYNQHTFLGAKDHIYAPMTSGDEVAVEGYEVDYRTDVDGPSKKYYQYDVKTYPYPGILEKGLKTAGILQSASYLIYHQRPEGEAYFVMEGTPIEKSGIQEGDRLVWVDGEYLFSQKQLSHILNDHRALLTIKRDGETFLRRVPRVSIQDLRMDTDLREEISDWQYEAGLIGTRTSQLSIIPYNITSENIVEGKLTFIDEDSEKEAFPQYPFSALEEPLLPGDKIIAIYGQRLSDASELLNALQKDRVLIIVQRNPKGMEKVSQIVADEAFDREVNWDNIKEIIESIGSLNPIVSKNHFFLLKPITPKKRRDFEFTEEGKALYANKLLERKRAIESIDDPDKKAQLLSLLDKQEEEVFLGLEVVSDRKIDYNPNPFELFYQVFAEI